MSDDRWIPLESNPKVFNKWASQAGLLNACNEFDDILGTDDELLTMVPQPVRAVILVFPWTDDLKKKRDARYADKLKELGEGHVDPTIIWIKQTIRNACGTMAIIHALANSGVDVEPLSPISKFIEECMGLDPEGRATLLENTKLFKDIHATMANEGQSAVPADLNVDLHFTCFVHAPHASTRETGSGNSEESEEPKSNRLIELDGTRDGPVDHGPTNEEDFLKDAIRVVREDFMSLTESHNFSLMYLGPVTPASP